MNTNITYIPNLVKELGSCDGSQRRGARSRLVDLGSEAIQYLIAALYDEDPMIRCQAAVALYEINNPHTPYALVKALEDDNPAKRWDAAENLVCYDRAGVLALLEALTHNFDSPLLRQGARHVFRSLKKSGRLTLEETKVLEAFNRLETASVVPWAAQAALESLKQSGCIEDIHMMIQR
jgi:HEAT repeat protein